MDPTRRNLTYREMSDNSPVIGGVLLLLDLLVKQVEWDIRTPEGMEEDPVAVEQAAFVDSCFLDLGRPFKDAVSDFLSFVPFGWSYHNVVFKRRNGFQPEPNIGADGKVIEGPVSSLFSDGKVGWDKFAGRAQSTLDRWIFSSRGDIVAMVQRPPNGGTSVTIPLSRALHFRTSGRHNNPEGRSVLRTAYRPWYFHKTIEEIMAIGIDRDLAGTPVLEVPGEYMKARANLPANLARERDQWEKLVRNIRRGAKDGILMPLVRDRNGKERFKLSLLTTGGRRQFDIKGLLEYYDQRMAMAALSDVILLGHETVGSFALADSKTNLTAMFGSSLTDIITGQFNRRAIPALMRINGMDPERAPLLVPGDMESLNLEELAIYVQALSGAGMPLFPNEALEGHLLAAAGLPGESQELE
ncbi:hypothetical protein LCGC14_0826330 [marine sediment metagenome]|uniref:Phage portal protein n=1 Tax=marine sediment metagenome TaxID=412755 RepID=A0A0F9PH98_9ZZZZ